MATGGTGLTCIVNTAAGAGHGPALAAEIARLCLDIGAIAKIIMVPGPAGITAEARKAIDRGGLVLAGGGDGTVNAVASALVGTNGVLGILPLGTRNHFAKDLGLPLSLSGALRVALTGQARRVDLGEVNGQIFLNNSSIGLYPHLVIDRVAERKRGHHKCIALVLATLSCLRHPLPLLVSLRFDGADALERRTPMLLVGNNRYHIAEPRMGERDRLDAGELWMLMARRGGFAGLLGIASRALAGDPRPGDLETRSMAELWVATRRRQVMVAWDGEVTRMRTPLRYRIRPGALRVMAPS